MEPRIQYAQTADAAAARAAFGSPAGVATTQDVAMFAQPEKTQIVIAEEIGIVP
jgi:hypothetical protein